MTNDTTIIMFDDLPSNAKQDVHYIEHVNFHNIESLQELVNSSWGWHGENISEE